MELARGRVGWIILVATLAVSGALVLLAYAPEERQAAHDVAVKVHHGPSNTTFFDGTLNLTSHEATALGALERAAAAGAFDVTVSSAYWEPFVTQVGAHANEGVCGWVFDVDGVRSARGAASTTVASGAFVDWYWACEG